MFRRKSSTVKIFCSDTHFLIFYKYVIIKYLCYINTLENNQITKKHFKVNKIRINCYRYPRTDNNKADNANCYKK